MTQLDPINGLMLFVPTKREETNIAINRISDLLRCDFSYTGITSEHDTRINGYQDVIDQVKGRIDFKTHPLIIVHK